MEVWLDSINLDVIQQAVDLGILTGVTTNPSLLAKLSLQPQEFIHQVLQIHNGLITVQVINRNKDLMLEEARKLHYFHPNIVIKIPVTQDGLFVLSRLVAENIACMATAVYSVKQCFIAAKIGCQYIAPYFGRMKEQGIDAEKELLAMQSILEKQNFMSKILVAAIRNIDQVLFCAINGIKAVTLAENIFQDLLQPHSLTLKSLEQFTTDWQKNFSSSSVI